MQAAVRHIRRIPTGPLIGSALCLVSAALYFYFAAVWGTAALTDDTVAESGSISLHGWPSAVMSAVAASGGCLALFAARAGVRRWASDKTLAVVALTAGAAIGILPAPVLLTVPANA